MHDNKMSFDELLTKWNNGINIGAQSRLATELKITQTTVSRWVSGDSRPAEKMRVQVAKILGVSSEKLNIALVETLRRIQERNIARQKDWAIESTTDAIIARFEALKRLLNKNVINQEEYNEKRKKLLDEL